MPDRKDTARTIPAGEFKSRCLRLMETVHRDGFSIVVTKRGKPLVRIVAEPSETPRTSLLGTITSEAADISSTGEVWDAGS
jgi:prevent-host-death family protein